MKAQTRKAMGVSALTLGSALMSIAITSPAAAQAYTASACGTCNIVPFSWGPNGAPAITPWNNPSNIGSRMNGLYNYTVIPPLPFGQPFFHYVLPKQSQSAKR